MITRKATKPIARNDRRARASALNAPRRRVHALAPEHVGELGSVAALAVAVLGMALLIVAATLVVNGLTMGSRYDSGGALPPNIGQLGATPILAGAGLLILGLLTTAAPIALLADVRWARFATIALALLCAGLAVAVLLGVISRPSPDQVVTAALGVAAFLFGAAALVLARPGR